RAPRPTIKSAVTGLPSQARKSATAIAAAHDNTNTRYFGPTTNVIHSHRTTQTASCRYRLQPAPAAQEPPPIRRAAPDYSRIVARRPSPHWKWVHCRPRIRIRSGQRGRRTAARVADIRVSRIQAQLDQNPANRSERRPVRYKPPATEESSTVVARRSCG